MASLALISLGSNLGDRKSLLEHAVASLAETFGVVVLAVSSAHETAPIGGPEGQGPFLNAAAALETTLDPFALHRVLLDLERQAGRDRRVRWGARTLDLDLILFDDRIIDTTDLTVPHPRMAVRRFVLAPLAEVAPDAVDPLTGRKVADLLDNLDRRPSYVALDLPKRYCLPLFRRLSEELGAIGLSTPDTKAFGSSVHPRLESMVCPWVQAARELRSDRWSTDRWGDRWVITDFWFDRIALEPVDAAQSAGSPPPLDRLADARSLVLPPTFVVSDRSSTPMRTPGPGVPSAEVRLDPKAPILRVSLDSIDEVASDVLAACRSSRGG